MAEFRAASHIEVRSRRFRASATIAVTVAVGTAAVPAPSRRPVRESSWVPRGLTDAAVRWDALPARIRPEDWITEHADPAVPGSILAAEERRPEILYYPGG